MGLRTNPDRIPGEHRPATKPGRGRSRRPGSACHREKNSTRRFPISTPPRRERLRRIFGIVERSYAKAASNVELGKLASHFRAVGDIPTHHARGDVSVAIQYMDSPRPDDVGMAPLRGPPGPPGRGEEGDEDEPPGRQRPQGAPPRDPGRSQGGVQESGAEDPRRPPGSRRHGPPSPFRSRWTCDPSSSPASAGMTCPPDGSETSGGF